MSINGFPEGSVVGGVVLLRVYFIYSKKGAAAVWFS